jgi:hypothetical protein
LFFCSDEYRTDGTVVPKEIRRGFSLVTGLWNHISILTRRLTEATFGTVCFLCGPSVATYAPDYRRVTMRVGETVRDTTRDNSGTVGPRKRQVYLQGVEEAIVSH